MSESYDGPEAEGDDRDASDYEDEWGGPDDDEEDLYEDTDEEEEEYDGRYDTFDEPVSIDQLIQHYCTLAQAGDEKAAARHFEALKQKYGAEHYSNASPMDRLYKIFLKLESQGDFDLDDAEYAWLKQQRLRDPFRFYAARAAETCERRFRDTHDPWSAVRASRFWRDAGQAAHALAITETLAVGEGGQPANFMSAVLTTRGGAYRDLKRLDDAEKCGQRAVQLAQYNYHPYMLLGAVYFQMGQPELGDEYFAKGMQLGAGLSLYDGMIRDALKYADENERQIVAKYLLQKDPLKYGWARKYVPAGGT